jgi:MOSC domain-containing protein
MKTRLECGRVASLWRYPVKSMLGEELQAAEITSRGVRGDRAYALVDLETGRVASAKHPRKWPTLFQFRAAFTDPLQPETVRITLPDGRTVTSDAEDCNEALSRSLGRSVRLDGVDLNDASRASRAEGYWPDVEGLASPDTEFEFGLRPGMFFDGAILHLLTTATLNRLTEFYPEGRFDPRRYRPNIVIEPPSGDRGFVENDWIGQTLAIGNDVQLTITRPCGRCVMTTLPQGDLPADPGILRTVVQHNHANVGVYASVARGGTIRRGDAVRSL